MQGIHLGEAQKEQARDHGIGQQAGDPLQRGQGMRSAAGPREFKMALLVQGLTKPVGTLRKPPSRSSCWIVCSDLA